jgi:hypothetical protein
MPNAGDFAPRVAAGLEFCARCGRPIMAGERWDLGHVDGGGPRDWSGAEHLKCNRGAPGRRASLNGSRSFPAKAPKPKPDPGIAALDKKPWAARARAEGASWWSRDW